MFKKIMNLVSPVYKYSKNVPRTLSTSVVPKAKEDRIKVKNYEINYVKIGNGPQSVLFLPGALGTIWTEGKPQIEGFNREKFTLVVWDPPGYGKSRPPEKVFTTDFYEKDADVAQEFMKALGIPKYSVMGFSDGGITGLIHAAKYPNVVNKLVVWGANTFILPQELEMFKKIKNINAWSKRLRDPLIEIYGEKLFARYWASWVDAMEAICKEKNGNICSELLKDIKCPTFILYGQKDPLVDSVHVSHLHTNIDGSRARVWATYCFPDGDWKTEQTLAKLYTQNKYLCSNHFDDTAFTSTEKKRLNKYAIPTEARDIMSRIREEMLNKSTAAQESAVEREQPVLELGPGCTLQSSAAVSVEPQAGPSCIRIPFVDITHMQNVTHSKPSVSGPSHEVVRKSERPSTQSEKEKILFAKCKKYMRKTCVLRNRIKNLRKKAILNILTDDSSVKKLSKKITPAFALLLQGQIRNFKNKVTGYRWSKQEKITALRIYKRSPTCYRLLRRMFHLPSPSTLKTLLNKVPFNVGVHETVLKVLKQFITLQKPTDNNFVLMFDEMSIKKHLNYNTRENYIEGCQDHGSQGRSPTIASYALVFMIAGIRKRVKQPIAHYFSSANSTADRLAVLIKQVLEQCFSIGANIVAIVCDMDGVNRRALAVLGASLSTPYITVHNKEIVTLYDPPHLLKCFRNLFMKYDIEIPVNITSGNKTGKGIAKWSHIKEFYELDNINPNFVYAPVLKKDHLNPNTKQKMKVNLAAQVFSHSVAGGMYAMISRGDLHASAVVTADLVSKMDKLFDSLNSDSSDLRRGKPLATNLTNTSGHIHFFHEMKHLFLNLKFIGCPRTPPSQEGWVWTINAVEKLWANLVGSHNIRSLATRRLQQDPLENLFGCIRGNCGSNTNPTTAQFAAGLKTAILSNLSYIGTTGNCETDNNVIINNFETFLSGSRPVESATPESHIIESQLLENVSENEGEIQACAYVCGFIVKNIKNDCKNCRIALLSDTVESHHLFVESREYSEHKNSLKYVSRDMVTCVECSATIINEFLTNNWYKLNLKNIIIENLKHKIDFDFLNICTDHKEKNINDILNSVTIICLKRYCILKNRLFAEEASASALKRKMSIILHK